MKKKLAKWVVTAAMLSICALMTLYVSLPGIVRERAVAELNEKGWTGTIGKVEVQWDHVVLHDVQIQSVDGWAEVAAASVVVHREGTSPGNLSIRSPVVTLNGPKPSTSRESGRTRTLTVTVQDGHVEWKDPLGPKTWIKGDGVSATWGPDGLTASAEMAESSGPKWDAVISGLRVVHGGSVEIDEIDVELKTDAARRELADGRTSAEGTSKGRSVDLRIGKARVESRPFELDTENMVIAARVTNEGAHLSVRAWAVSAHGIRAENVHVDAMIGKEDDWNLSIKSSAERVSASSRATEGRIEIAELSMEAQASARLGEIAVHKATIRSGSLTASLSGGVTSERVWGMAEIPRAPCQDMFDSLPRSMQGGLLGTVMEGQVSARLTLDVDMPDRKSPAASFKMQNECVIKQVPPEYRLGKMSKRFQRTVVGLSGGPLEMESGPGSAYWTPIGHVSRHVPVAVMAMEDQFFLSHRGILNKAVENSIALNVKDGKFTRGASTITMQLAKNLWLGREKTAVRKLQEAVLATYLEQRWSKDRIMEYYVNVVEFAPGVYGIGRAAHHYFRTDATQLTLSQALFLASILPSPSRTHFQSDGELSHQRLALIRRVMKAMQQDGRISTEEYAEAASEVPRFRQPVRREGVEPIRVSDGGVSPDDWN